MTQEEKEFFNVFGEDILSKAYDIDLYKGGAYIEVVNGIVYVIEVSWECNSVQFIKFENIDVDKVFEKVVDETQDYCTIGKIYYQLHKVKNNNNINERLRRFVECLYSDENDYFIDEYKTYNSFYKKID